MKKTIIMVYIVALQIAPHVKANQPNSNKKICNKENVTICCSKDLNNNGIIEKGFGESWTQFTHCTNQGTFEVDGPGGNYVASSGHCGEAAVGNDVPDWASAQCGLVAGGTMACGGVPVYLDPPNE